MTYDIYYGKIILYHKKGVFMKLNNDINEPTIRITIDKKQDLELFEFADAMAAINRQYFSFLNSSGTKIIPGSHKLYIRKLTEGSIIVDLCEKAPLMLPIIQPYLGEFYEYITSILNYLCSKTTDHIYRLMKSDWSDFKKILEPIVNIKGSNLSLVTLNINSPNINNYNYIEASAGQNKADREIKKLGEGDCVIKENVELSLFQARNSNISRSMLGNMGIIAEICPKPKVLNFSNDRICYAITKADENPFNFIYKVDVEVKFKNEKLGFSDSKNIATYEVLKLHGVVEKQQSDIFDTKEEKV